MSERLALFDIDGTLLDPPSSERRFIRHLFARRQLGARQLLSWTVFPPRYARLYGATVWQKNKAYLDGLQVTDVAEWATDFVTGQLVAAWRQAVLARLRDHQAAGDRVILLSGTSQFLAQAIAASIGADDAVGTLCDVDGTCFTARPPLSHPFGEEKRRLAATLCDRYHTGLDSVVAYGDSHNDIPLLLAVGCAVAVTPGRRLGRLAASRGWEVLGGGPVDPSVGSIRRGSSGEPPLRP